MKIVWQSQASHPKKKIFFLAALVACGIFVPRPGIESRATAVKEPSLNHWTARELPILKTVDANICISFYNIIFSTNSLKLITLMK